MVFLLIKFWDVDFRLLRLVEFVFLRAEFSWNSESIKLVGELKIHVFFLLC